MNKKVISLILAAIMVLFCVAFAGCGSDKETTTTPDTSESGTSGNNSEASVDDLAYITKNGKMVIGITDVKPMNYKEEGSTEWTGFDTEFAQKVCKELGVEAEFIEIDWDNKFYELKSKAIDAVWNGMTITDEAKLNSSVSNPYVINAQVVVMKADKLDSYKTADSMKDLKFVAEAGSAGEAEAKKIASEENYTAVKTQADALVEVKSGSADACIVDITAAKTMTGEGTSYADLGYGLELSKEEYGISFRQGSNLTEKVNSIMDELKKDGTLQSLAEKYGLTLA